MVSVYQQQVGDDAEKAAAAAEKQAEKDAKKAKAAAEEQNAKAQLLELQKKIKEQEALRKKMEKQQARTQQTQAGTKRTSDETENVSENPPSKLTESQFRVCLAICLRTVSPSAGRPPARDHAPARLAVQRVPLLRGQKRDRDRQGQLPV